MRAVIVSVDYADILSETLPRNRPHWEQVLVITSPTDMETVRVARQNGCLVHPSKRFWEKGEHFNKFAALDHGIEHREWDRWRGWLCLAPWVRVEADQVRYASRRFYSGPLLVLRTAQNRTIAMTPDHKVLTEQGWRSAKTLHKGDNLFHVRGIDPVRTPQVNKKPSPIGEVIDSLFERATRSTKGTGGQVRPMRRGMYLKRHLPNSNVDVVRADRLLTDDLKPCCQAVTDLSLKASDSALSLLLANRHTRQSLVASGNPHQLFPSFGNLHSLNFRRFSLRPNNACLTAVTNPDTCQNELPCNRSVVHPVELGNGLLTLTGQVSPDNLISVEVISWQDHVYDLSTAQGWFTADDVIVHNCLVDADIIWPRVLPFRGNQLQPGCLYSFRRRRLLLDPTAPVPPESEWGSLPLDPQWSELLGYTQIFHTSDPSLGRKPWHKHDLPSAGLGDSFFQYRWPPDRRVWLDGEVLHIGEYAQNWCGRVTPYRDGTVPPHAAQRKRHTDQIKRAWWGHT